MAKIYTRTGDKGTTGLADGSRIEKDHLRIESYGTIDELNSIIGICRCHLAEINQRMDPAVKPRDDTFSPRDDNSSPASSRGLTAGSRLDSWLFAIQNDLFNLGADLATPIASRWKKMIIIDETDVKQLEHMIDLIQKELPVLHHFVLPGGTLLNSYLHLARTVCRRAERHIVSLMKSTEINQSALIYVNRLSDLFFMMARYAQHCLEKPEMKWDSQMGVRFLSFEEK